MENQKKIGIILLNYNGYKDTVECIESLEKITYKNIEIVIVDNKSTDDSFINLKKYLDGKHNLIQSGKNKGFAYGNNIGIAFAISEKKVDYVLLLNNDTEVKEDFIEELLKGFEKNNDIEEEVGISCGKILNFYDRNIVWYGGGEINWKRFYGYHIEDHSYDDRKYVTFATGCLMLIKKEVIEKIGYLSEEYFMYYEDVDYCAKVLKAKYKIKYNSKAIIYHKVAASSGGGETEFAIEWNTRNRIRFMNNFRESISKMSFLKAKAFFYGSRIIKMLIYLIKKEKKKSDAVKKGLIK